MTISSAFSNALSGLSAASRGVDVVSSNMANIGTDGYGRRTLELGTRTYATSGGVRIEGVMRHVDQAVLSDRRIADANLTHLYGVSSFLSDLEMHIGLPGDTGSLNDVLNKFHASLIQVVSEPDSDIALYKVHQSGASVVDKINEIASAIEKSRTDADHRIATYVDRLNSDLKSVEAINSEISTTLRKGYDTLGLEDQRDQVLDRISKAVPIKTAQRDNGRIAIYSDGGAILLDGPASRFEFTQTNVVTYDHALESENLSGLTLNGRPLRLDGEKTTISGGALAAEFEVRDNYTVNAQTALDEFASDLIQMFEKSSVAIDAGNETPGLFTDQGGVFTGEISGSGNRIAINVLSDPEFGGRLATLRDGFGASLTRPVGDISVLNAMLKQTQKPNLFDLAADMISSVGVQKQKINQQAAYFSTLQNELMEMQLSNGVDSDHELQKLMQLEKNYAANAKVIQTLDQMLQVLMGL